MKNFRVHVPGTMVLVLVTGGNKGIGYSIVKLLFKSGVDSLQCIFTSRTQANGQKAIENLVKVKH